MALALVASGLAVGLAGCGPDPLHTAVGEVTSARATAQLAVAAHAQGRLTQAAATTAVDDAITEASAALKTIAERDRQARTTRWAADQVSILQRLRRGLA